MPPSSVTPSSVVRLVIEPPVIITLFEFCVAIVPKPSVVRAVAASASSNSDLANAVIVDIAAAAAPVVCLRRNAQYLPSKVVTMFTTSQPSVDFFVSSAASASGFEL